MELVNNLPLNSSADTPRNGLQRYAFFPYKPKPPLRTHLPHHTLLAVTFLLRLLCSPPFRFIQTKVKNTYSRRSRSEALPKTLRSPAPLLTRPTRSRVSSASAHFAVRTNCTTFDVSNQNTS